MCMQNWCGWDMQFSLSKLYREGKTVEQRPKFNTDKISSISHKKSDANNQNEIKFSSKYFFMCRFKLHSLLADLPKFIEQSN